MKKLLVLVLALILAAFFARSSVYYSVFQLQQGIDRGDVDQVLRHADLQSFAELPVDLTVAMAAAESKDAAGVLGEALVKAFGGALGAGVKQIGGQLAAQQLRDRIAAKELSSLTGGFRPNSGLGWFGGVQSVGESRIVTVVGSCESREDRTKRIDVPVGITFLPSKGPWAGYPVDWRAMGVEANSLKQLVRDCRFTF
ncbi:MAG: hypothetical protein SFW67_27100 [Myxococcaceae bacterium]|nr:hypothetical protein [Myxococcaceae bacterium]